MGHGHERERLALAGAARLRLRSGDQSLWIVIGLATGTLLNWIYTSKRLRRYTQVLDALTLPDYFEFRFRDRSRFLRVLSVLMIFLFFLFYTASGLVGTGKLFEAAYGMDFTVTVFIGAVVLVGYTFLSGFLAVSWTDLFQGLMMFFALLIMPVAVIVYIGGFGETVDTIAATNPTHLGLVGENVGALAIFSFIAGNLAWGLGYFGQPRILVRFMAI